MLTLAQAGPTERGRDGAAHCSTNGVCDLRIVFDFWLLLEPTSQSVSFQSSHQNANLWNLVSQSKRLKTKRVGWIGCGSSKRYMNLKSVVQKVGDPELRKSGTQAIMLTEERMCKGLSMFSKVLLRIRKALRESVKPLRLVSPQSPLFVSQAVRSLESAQCARSAPWKLERAKGEVQVNTDHSQLFAPNHQV
jgi:hypothetical protein